MRWVFATITLWLVFVLSLSAWWMIFGLKNLEMLSVAHLAEGSQLLRHQKMLFYEGLVLVVSLVLGGGGLFYFTWRMYQEKSATEKFFASFTHDIKTSIFRLQLQVEKLAGGVAGDDEMLSQVLAGTRRLNLHLENGLDSALGGRQNLFIENIDMFEFIAELHAEWPEIEIQLRGTEKLRADRKALRSVFRNLLHNSFLHGRAEEVTLLMSQAGDQVNICYRDNGHPFAGELNELGQKPQTSAKGSGFGLYLVRYWLLRMQGSIAFSKSDSGQLIVNMQLPRAQ